MANDIYVLGGHQTDFARNYSREGLSIFDLLKDGVEGAFAAVALDSAEIEVAHVGNFVGELFTGQGMLGGFLGHVHGFGGRGELRHPGEGFGNFALLQSQCFHEILGAALHFGKGISHFFLRLANDGGRVGKGFGIGLRFPARVSLELVEP